MSECNCSFNGASSSTTLQSFNNIAGASFLHTKIHTTGRDHHEMHHHNHYYSGASGSFHPMQVCVAAREDTELEDPPMKCVALKEVNPVEELLDRRHYRVHSAKYKNRFVIVKVFEGVRAKECFEKAVTTSCSFLHPNILRVAAISFPKSKTPFIVFDSSCESGSVTCRHSSAITEDLPRSVRLGFQIVGGLSAGLDYLSNSCVPVGDIKRDMFEVYFTQDETVKIGIDTCEVNRDPENCGEEDRCDTVWTIFDDLCTKTFNDANRLLYQEENVERRQVDISDVELDSIQEHDPTILPSNVASTSSSIRLVTSSTSSHKPRRELVWNGSRRETSTVASVAQQYRNHLRIQHPSTNALVLRRVKARKRASTVKHRCQGYNREEITLTSNIKNNAIISHSIPAPYEICLICGEIVREAEPFRCVCGQVDDGVSSTIKCLMCGVWQHNACVSTTAVNQRQFLCFYCVLGSNDASPPPHVLSPFQDYPGSSSRTPVGPSQPLPRTYPTSESDSISSAGFDGPLTDRRSSSPFLPTHSPTSHHFSGYSPVSTDGSQDSDNSSSSSKPESPNKTTLRPPKLAPSAWQLYFTGWIQRQQVSNTRKLNVAQAAKEAGLEYSSLSPEEKEPYKRRSQRLKEARERELAAYMRTLTPDDIRRENAFRAAQRKAGKSRKSNIKDPNAPKKPLSAYFMFIQKIRSDPVSMREVFGDETETTKQSVLMAARWRGMTDDERKPFLAQAEREKMEYETAKRLHEEGTAGSGPAERV